MGSVALDSDALDQLHGEQKALLDTIDDLRKHGIQRFVDLPQIIVVGDQSSGKSSVLEAISRVRFPVKDGLCTRFATELVLRTDPQTRVDVQTQPSVTSGKEAHVFNETGFDQDEFPRIIEDAKNRMLQGSAAFSEDVLRVVISGPDVPHLTMVDLPGFYHSEDENQSAADRELVDRLVEHYMARKHSIILAIVSARNQVILQRVLSKVKQHDKKRVRTLGIITKPDLLVTGSKEEDSFLRLAKNLDKSHQLSLGWHVLRNRGETEGSYSHEERDQKEEDFFNEGVWHTIPSRNRGVRPLRKRLSTILLEHIKGNLQGVINGIEEQMIDRQNQLKALGQPRSTTPEMQAHLDRIASRFHILSLQAIEGNYSDDFFGGLFTGSNASSIDSNRVKKLRAFVRDMHHAFTYVLGTKGSTRVIVDDELDDHPYRGSDDDDEEDSDDVDQEEESVDDQENCNRLGAGKELLAPPLRPLVAQYKLKAPKKVTFDSIAAELELLASANQGNEFPGTANDRIAVQFFKDQAQPWESIARFHLHLVLKYTKGFVENVIQHVAGPDERTASTVLSEIIDPFFEEREALLESKLQELLKHFRRGYPQPLDTQFRRLLASRRRKKLTNQMMQNLLSERPELFTNEAAERLEEGPSAAPEGRFAVGELIDKAETYYDMSLRTFADNIIVLAVENCLVTEIPSIFTTEMVCQMSSEEVKRLGAEAPEIQVERTEVQAEYDALRKGLTLCNKYRARGATVVPSVLVDTHGQDVSTLSGGEPEEVYRHQISSSDASHPPSPAPSSRTPGEAAPKVSTKRQGKSARTSSNNATKTTTLPTALKKPPNVPEQTNPFQAWAQFGSSGKTPTTSIGGTAAAGSAIPPSPFAHLANQAVNPPFGFAGASGRANFGNPPPQVVGGLFGAPSTSTTPNPFASGSTNTAPNPFAANKGTPSFSFTNSLGSSKPSDGTTAFTSATRKSTVPSNKPPPDPAVYVSPRRNLRIEGESDYPWKIVRPSSQRENATSQHYNHFFHICFQRPYYHYSPEELRLDAISIMDERDMRKGFLASDEGKELCEQNLDRKNFSLEELRSWADNQTDHLSLRHPPPSIIN